MLYVISKPDYGDMSVRSENHSLNYSRHSPALLISAIVIIFALDNAHCLAGTGCP